MPAITVKLDASLLREIAGFKPKDQPLSGYVREALRVSFAVVRGVRQAKKSRISKQIAIAPANFLQSIEQAVAAYLTD